MTRTLNRQWIREVDRRAIEDYGMSGLVLMENAARGVVDVMQRLDLLGKSIAVCCGKGNNGGDGFAIARRLDLLGASVRVFAFCDRAELRGDAAANFAILQKCELPMSCYGAQFDETTLRREMAGCDVIVDALLGTGSTGNPRPPLDRVIEILNAQTAIKIAVDIPSGLDCDTGVAGEPTFRADHTVTFVAPKPGLVGDIAKVFVGELHVADIGAPRVLVEQILRESLN